MLQAKTEFNKRIKNFGKTKVDDFINFILNNAIFLIYPVDDYTASIKMFETINDRGMPLGYFDKIKSFFLYYSDKFANRRLDDIIELTFDHIYQFFDKRNLALKVNNDATLLLYHYISNPVLFCGWSYTKSTENIYLDFKKEVINYSQSNVSNGENYIRSYLNDLYSFIDSCLEIEEKIKNNHSFREFYLLLEPNQRMFPLSIRFNQKGILNLTLSMLEKIEFYLKFRRDPKKDIFKLLKEVIEYKGTNDDLIIHINNTFYYIFEWQDYAIDIVNSATWAAKYALYQLNKKKYNQEISVSNYKAIEVEHIFSHEPSFPISKYGYDEESYRHLLNNIGNLTLLEKELNGPSGASNKPPEDKISQDYLNSDVILTQKISIKDINDVKQRSSDIELFLDEYFVFDLI